MTGGPPPSQPGGAAPSARQRFQEERLSVAIALRAKASAIEHVGSTAIAGIEAGPVVDILIGLRGPPLAEAEAVPPLVSCGYEQVEGDESAGQIVLAKGAPAAYHAHVVVHDGPVWRRIIIFRDWLNLRPDRAKEYEALNAAARVEFGGDRAALSEGRNAFVERVLEEAAKFPALRLTRR
jgi:GrpB-like predicted nucleotidyltransferase (UPF0157 family)